MGFITFALRLLNRNPRRAKVNSRPRSLKKRLVLRLRVTQAYFTMKKLLSIVAVLALVGMVLLTGCKQEEAAPTPPAVPATNAPAAP
jgi:hypothetical protein